MSSPTLPPSQSQPKDSVDPDTDIDTLPAHLNPKTYPRTLTTTHGPNQTPIHLELTYTVLSPTTALSTISSPSSGANVLFVGTTRDTFEDRPVAQLSYTCYPALALKSLDRIARDVVAEYKIGGLYIAHRLGVVPVGEASIIVAVGAGHRGEAWRGAESVLEVVKERVEVWKREEFVDGGMEWRENRERDSSGRKVLS